MLGLFAIPATAFVILQNRNIQTFLASRIASTISRNLEADFEIQSLDLIFFNRVVMKEVLLKDQYADTLLYSPRMIATLKTLNPSQKKIELSRLGFEKSLIRLSTDSSKVINLKFITDALKKPPDTTRKEKYKVVFNRISFEDSRFVYENHFKPRQVEHGINFTDLELRHMDLDVAQLRVIEDTILFDVNHLAFREESGFVMEHLQASVGINAQFFRWEDVHFETEQSEVNCALLDFRFNKWKDFGNKGIFDKVELDFRFDRSRIHLPDAAYFAAFLPEIDQTLDFEGRLRGRLSAFKGDDIHLSNLSQTRFAGSFDLQGLPEIRETFMYFDIDELVSTVSDMETFIADFTGESTGLSPTLSKLGKIIYRGKYAGYYNDFVSYGTLASDLGIMRTDLSIRPDENDNVYFRGDLSTEGFDLGKLSEPDTLTGLLSMNGNVEGVSHAGGEISGKMDGNISLLELNGYPYRNISLSGELSNRRFDGSFSVEDPNLRMEFFGEIDYTDSLPQFDFTANVDKAMLYPLNFTSSDPEYQLSCYLKVNFTGTNLDDFNGQINLVNSLFQKSDKQIQIYDFTLLARHRPDTNRLHLKSDLVDMEVVGQYEFDYLGYAMGKLLSHHLPSFGDPDWIQPEDTTALNRFRFRIDLKNLYPITDFFYPEIEFARQTVLAGYYDPGKHVLDIDASVPELKFRDFRWKDLQLALNSSDSAAHFTTRCQLMESGELIDMENLLLQTRMGQDRLDYRFDWLNSNPEDLYRGALSGHAELEKRENRKLPRIDLYMNRGEVVIRDSIWLIHPALISFDTNVVSIEAFKVEHEGQSLALSGKLSPNPSDIMEMQIQHFDLRQLNLVTSHRGLLLAGMMNGNVSISDLYGNPTLLSDIRIDSLSINEEKLGNTFLMAQWIRPEQKINININTMRGQLQTLALTGDYYPDSRKLDLALDLNKLRLNIIAPYLDEVVENLSGIASGQMTLGGTLRQPLLNGNINLQKTSAKVLYLQAEYSLSDELIIRDNNLQLEEVRIYDDRGSLAILDGEIRSNYLRNFQFDLNLNARDFNFLHTSAADNQDYYGDAVATGLVRLSGTPGNIRLDITARTERGTRIFIPINQGRKITENDFITFKGAEEAEMQEKEARYQRNLGNFSLDFNLEITPQATAEIVFDPQVGDIISANGSGNLQILINPQDEFQIFGDYVIERGEYLFTLQNIINKRLKVQRGGTIKWEGDPTSAVLNMRAVYETKAAPGVLIPDPPERLKTRMPVECHLLMEGNLLGPVIDFEIVLPTAEEETRNVVRNAISTEEDLTKQFLSLLVINNFISTATSTVGSGTSQGAGMAGVTASELLSNQLSNWLSQISNDFDIGVNYRPGGEISSDQVEVALSTQIFDDRVSIHTNVDVSSNAPAATTGQQTSTIAGDFDLEVKLTDNGRLRLKAYNRYNHDQLYKTSPYTQGVGFVYREDFNTFGELGKRYLDAITGENRRKKKKLPPEKGTADPVSQDESETGTEQ